MNIPDIFRSDCLQGQHVFVTGGGSGLGLAMAREMAACGAKVSITGRNEEKLALACEGTDMQYFQADVRDPESIHKALDNAAERSGALTDLINNAAGNFLCSSEDLTPGGFRAVVETVLFGSFYASQHFGKKLIEAGIAGSILNIVTTYAESGSAFVLPSACAKAGVSAMTKTLAYEWGPYDIRCNAIAPGPFPTDGAWKRLVPTEDLEETFRNRVALGRFGVKRELANLAVFLVSRAAPFITGEVVTIDGGEKLNAGQFNFLAQSMSREDLKSAFEAMRGATRKAPKDYEGR